MEIGDRVVVEDRLAQVAVLSVQQGDDFADHMPDVFGWDRFNRSRGTTEQSVAGSALVTFRQLQADDAAIAPDDAAATDRRLKECKAERAHCAVSITLAPARHPITE